MANTDPAAPSRTRLVTAAVSFVGGVGLLVASFILPGQSMRRGNWSPDQARAYQKASIKLHGLTHEFEHAGNKDQALTEKLSQAQAEYGELRTQLESAINRPNRVATTLQIIAGLLIVVGVITIVYRRAPSQ